MGKLPYARRFSELVVYQLAKRTADEIFKLTGNFPRDEAFAIRGQLRRSSRSMGAQIAEAWAKRRYRRHFIAKLTDAIAEELETQHWLLAAVSCGYLTEQQVGALTSDLDEVGSMLHSMIDKAHLFCDRKSIS